MRLRSAPLLVLPLFAVAAFAAPGASAASTAPVTASATPKTVIFNMYPSPLVQPKRIFFQANSGPFLDKIVWTGWGDAIATSTATWTLDCSNGGSSCSPDDPDLETHPARYILSDLAPCPRFGPKAKSYRSGTIEIDRNGTTDTVDFPSDYDFCAKPVTPKQAQAAIRKYVQRHQHVSKVTVGKCTKSGDVDLECRAHWTKNGKKRNRNFDVTARMNGPLLIFALGD